MEVVDLPRHALAVAHGVGAGLLLFTACWLCGLAWLPRRADRGLDGDRFDASPAVVGAAIYAAACWFAVRRGVPLGPVVAGFVVFAVAAVAIRHQRILGGLRARRVLSAAALAWTGAFALLYGVGYLFFTPSVNGEFLPLTTYTNLDIYWYLTFTRYLQELGPSNVAGYSFQSYVYLQTPGVFYVLGFVSACFGGDPMGAAMPMQFLCTAAVGLLAARLARTVFGVPVTAAVAIGCVLVSGPFFRYIAGNYFLSTLMSLPVLLHLVWLTSGEERDGRVIEPWLALAFAAHYTLLLLLYPVFLFAGLGLQAAVVGLRAAAAWTGPRANWTWRDLLRQAGRTAVASATAAAAVVAMFPSHLEWSYKMARYLSKAGVAGWPLDFISPLGLFGMPGRFDRTPLSDPSLRPVAMAGLGLTALALLLLFLWRHREETTAAEKVFAALGAGSLLAYVAYFLLLGPSYQQWKFASYGTLPLTFVTFAAGLRLCQLSQTSVRLLGTPARRLAARVAGWGAVAAMVGGNLIVHAYVEPPFRRWDAGLANLASIDGLPGFQELDVEMEEGGATMLAPYFIRDKTLHLVSLSYYPKAPLEPERITSRRPYLLQDFGCEGVGHGDTLAISGVGCLIQAPPSVMLGVSCPFSRTFLPVTISGLGPREPWGRWNVHRDVQIVFTADVTRMPADQDAVLALLLAPADLPGGRGQRLHLSWGDGRGAATRLTGREWISLPVQRRDWAGGPRLLTLEVTIALPDAEPVNAVDPASTETRPLAVRFEDAVFSATPLGRVVARAARAAGGPGKGGDGSS